MAGATSDSEGDLCCICLVELSEGGEVLVLPCTHTLHETCVKMLLSSTRAPTCPMCRADSLPERDENVWIYDASAQGSIDGHFLANGTPTLRLWSGGNTRRMAEVFHLSRRVSFANKQAVGPVRPTFPADQTGPTAVGILG